MRAQAQKQARQYRAATRTGGRACFTAGLLLLACLVGGPAHAQRMISGASGSVVWSGDERVPADNVPGELRVGATDTGYARGYLVFRPLPPDLLLGSGPVRLYVHVLAFPRGGQGRLTLAAYTVSSRFDARSTDAEQGQDGGFVWQQMSDGTILAEGDASDLAAPAPLGGSEAGRFQWLDAPPGPDQPLQVEGRPAPGWHYLELDAYASRDLREAVRRAQAAGGYLRLGLMARGVEGSLRIAGAGEQGYEPTLALGPTCEVEIQGPGAVRINGQQFDLPFRGDFPVGQPLTIEALPPAGEAQFAGWSGDLTSGARVVRVTLDRPLRLAAHYRTARTSLQVWASGGRVELDGWCPDSSWSRDFPYGAAVRLRAVPDPGYRFVGWLGDAEAYDPWLDISMEGSRQVWAVFERMELHREVRLRVGGWGGYVLVNGCYESLPFYGDFCRDDMVHLAAVPWPGYRFVGWDGDNGRVGGCTLWVRMDGSREVCAVFQEICDRPGGWSYHPPYGGYCPPEYRPRNDDRWRRANYEKPYPERRMSDPEGRGYGEGPKPGKPYPERQMENPQRGGLGGPPPPAQRPPDLRPPQPGDKPPAQGTSGPRQGENNPSRGGQGGSQPPAQRPPEARPQQPGDKPPAQGTSGPRQGENNPARGGQGGNQPPAQRPPEARPPQPADKPLAQGTSGPRQGDNNPGRSGQGSDQSPAQPPPQTRPQQPNDKPPAQQPPAQRPPAQQPREGDPARGGQGGNQQPSERPQPPAQQPPAANPNRPKPEERPQPPQARPDPPAERPQPPANNPNRPKPEERPKPAERPQPPAARPDPPAERPQPQPKPKPADPPRNHPAPPPPPRERPQPPPNDPPRGGQERPKPEERPKPAERPQPQDKPDKPDKPAQPARGGRGRG